MKKRTVTLKNLTIGAGLPAIAVPLVASNERELAAALEQVCAAGEKADLIEYRADYDASVLADEQSLLRALTQIREAIPEKPLLFTVRTATEGGEADLTFEEYSRVLLAASRSHLVDLIDVELFTAGQSAVQLTEQIHQAGACVIGSSHDFSSTPDVDEMIRRIEEMQRCDMDITKLAVMPRSRMDVLRLLEAAVRIDESVGDRPCVTMSMGAYGVISRISGTFTGSAITFATAGRASAPGQIPAERMKEIILAIS